MKLDLDALMKAGPARRGPADQEPLLRQKARRALRLCGEALFHVTTEDRLPGIVKDGLIPRTIRGQAHGTFKGRDRWSEDKVFLCGEEDLLFWKSEIGQAGEPVVVLWVEDPSDLDLLLDEKATSSDQRCSFYLKEAIPPSNLLIEAVGGRFVRVSDLRPSSRRGRR